MSKPVQEISGNKLSQFSEAQINKSSLQSQAFEIVEAESPDLDKENQNEPNTVDTSTKLKSIDESKSSGPSVKAAKKPRVR